MNPIFPSNPATGQIYQQWQWDGAKWIPIAGAAMDGLYSGYVNKLRNGTFDVWQRGTSIANVASGSYTADGWVVAGSSAAVSVSSGGSRGSTARALSIAGAAGNTGVSLHQNIESFVATALGGSSITFQAQIYNGTGATITPQLIIGHANATDNFGGLTNDVTVSLQPCPASQWTRVAYTAPAISCANGVFVWLNFGAMPSGYINITEADLRATPNWTVGLCANPPLPELRPIATELAFCQRYYNLGFGLFSGTVTNGYNYHASLISFPSMRGTPTIVLTDGGGNTNFAAGAPTQGYVGSNYLDVYKPANATAPNGVFQFNWTASAEL